MHWSEMITRRRSVRSYTGEPVGEELLKKLHAFAEGMVPLHSHIRTAWQIVPREAVKCLCPWTTPQVIAVYSEEKEGYLENVGFLFQQMDLYLQSLGLGTCWLGMGSMKDAGMAKYDGLGFVIMLAFGSTGSAQRETAADFRRKPLSAISDREDPCLEPARLAPSSVNSQPWYFTHDGGRLHAFCVRQGLLKGKEPGFMNRIDMGIALAHLYAENPDTFRFTQEENVEAPKGYGYIGSIRL